MSKMIAPCGIDCGVCDAYIATQTQDPVMKQAMVDNYKKNFALDISFSELDCDGCPSEGRHIGFCAKCGIRECAFGKGYATCAECNEFPCDKGSFIWTSNSVSKANLEQLRTR